MTLGVVAVTWPLIAGACLAAGLFHLAIWFKRRQKFPHLAFFFVCGAFALDILFELEAIFAQSPAEYSLILRWVQVPLLVTFVAIVVFLRSYLNAGRLWLAYVVCASRLPVLLATFFGGDTSLQFRVITELQQIELWGGEIASIPIGIRGSWLMLGNLSSLCLIFFVLDATVSAWRRTSGPERRRSIVVGGSFLLTIVSVSVAGALMHWGVIHHPFYFFGIFIIAVAATSNELANDLANVDALAQGVTEKNAQLLQAQQRMDLVFEAAQVGMWEWNFERDEIWVSEQARAQYGFAADEAVNFDRFLQALHDDDRELIRDAALGSIRDGARFQREYRIATPDGRISWVVTRGRVEIGEKGKDAILRGITVDISERKLADERFREVVEAAPTGMLIVGADGKIKLVNAQVEADFGYSRQELVGQSIELLIPESFRARHVVDRTRFSEALMARPMALNREVFGRCNKGHEIPLEIGLNPIHGAAGTEILATITNITERRRRELTLQEERVFLRQVLDIHPGLIFAKDRAGRFTLVNQAVADIYGTTIQSVIGRTDADFNRNPEEVQSFLQADLEVMDSLQKKFILEEQITDAAGKVHWLQTVKLPVLNSDGKSDLVLGSATDISERKLLELDLAQQRNELAHLSRVMSLSELSGSLAHELNQPLAAILSNAQAALRFLAREAPDLDEIREILSDIVADDRRAGEVIQGLRLMLKKGEVRREPMDANALVEDVIRLMRSDMLNAGVIYTTDYAPNLSPISGVRVQLQQVLLNLLQNACDSMADVDASRRRLVVSTKADAEGQVVFSVCDQGLGIPADKVTQVFEPFFTTKVQGMGLGLAVCRRLVDSHGGKMWATNNIGAGATLFFSIPVAENQTA